MNGKRVLITGGSKGIGKAIAKLLVSKGAKVLIFSRNDKNLEKAKKEIGDNLIIKKGDASNLDDVKRIFKVVDEKLGGLDILINNAGVPGSGIGDMESDSIEYLIKVNLIGYIFCVQEAVDRMKNGGHIINISSLSAKTLDGKSNVYNASKSGINGFNESIRKELTNKNIKVTLISPGAVATELHGLPLEKVLKLAEKEEMLYAEDIAKTVLFCLEQPERVDITNLEIKSRRHNI